jgi:hypothetical protein
LHSDQQASAYRIHQNQVRTVFFDGEQYLLAGGDPFGYLITQAEC